jgi:hypothetical protein
VALLLASTAGCRTMWDRVRERERLFAVENARTQTGRGQCVEALDSLDRAQARLDLGAYARESVLARIRCYEKLGLETLAAGHRRLLEDFYTGETQALPAADGSSVFRVSEVDPRGYDKVPSALEIERPRYSPYASRSKIVGRVVVAFDLDRDGGPAKLRVLEMPHPLLATWAMEAVAKAEPRRRTDATRLAGGGRYVTTFVFEWRWAKPEEEDEG